MDVRSFHFFASFCTSLALRGTNTQLFSDGPTLMDQENERERERESEIEQNSFSSKKSRCFISLLLISLLGLMQMVRTGKVH